MKKQLMSYDTFIRRARAAGILDDTIDFLWDIFAEYKPDPKDFQAPPKP